MQPRFRLSRRPEERIHVLGEAMDLVTPQEVFHHAKKIIASSGRAIIANHNLHSLFLIRRNAEMRAFFKKANLIEIDSLPLIFWARLIGRPSRRFHRCTYLDWRDVFWKTATENNWRVFFVGGQEGVAEAARESIQRSWPQAQLETHHGYFDMETDSADNRALIEAIHRYEPDVILVGMGMPRQETWVMRNYNNLPSGVVFTIGAAFDYEAGVQLACPRWLGQLGLEWLFRLILDPRRMFERYCIEPWHLIAPAMRDLGDVAQARVFRLKGLRRAIRSLTPSSAEIMEEIQ